MCGIVGLLSTSCIFDTAVRGLGKLEYRGYDSYGFVFRSGNDIDIVKAVGPIGDAIQTHSFDGIQSTQVLGHTRWATHGGVSEPNAHPHTSYDGRISIVHNGVIENYRELRRELADQGVAFLSETDSEVVAHLIAKQLEKGMPVLKALENVLPQLAGEYALGIIDRQDSGTLYGARFRSPLMIAVNDGKALLASDPIALEVTQEVAHLEDGDVVILRCGGVEVYHFHGSTLQPVERPSIVHEIGEAVASKAGYEHYMLKEIHECPQAIKTVVSSAESKFKGILNGKGTSAIVGAGSAFFVAMIGQYLFAELARETVLAVPSDEAKGLLRLGPNSHLIAVSQSGETYDTLEAIRIAKSMHAEIISITNVRGCTIERISTHQIQQGSGTEMCVLSTKSVVSQVAILLRLALERGRELGHISAERYEEISRTLKLLPDNIVRLIEQHSDTIKALAEKISHVSDWFFLGKGLLYPVALESALKFKEVSYHHAEGMPAGFLKHGTISLIRPEFFTIALLPSRTSDAALYQAVLSAVSEVVARGGPVIGIGPADIPADELASFEHYVPLTYFDDGVSDVFMQLVAGQLLAYHCAAHLGRNIDRPRGLAKSVTVR